MHKLKKDDKSFHRNLSKSQKIHRFLRFPQTSLQQLSLSNSGGEKKSNAPNSWRPMAAHGIWSFTSSFRCGAVHSRWRGKGTDCCPLCRGGSACHSGWHLKTMRTRIFFERSIHRSTHCLKIFWSKVVEKGIIFLFLGGYGMWDWINSTLWFFLSKTSPGGHPVPCWKLKINRPSSPCFFSNLCKFNPRASWKS